MKFIRSEKDDMCIYIKRGLLLFFPYLLNSQVNINYDPWDWVTYRFSQDVVSISDGPSHVYFASSGGILQYNIFGHYWDYPITTSQGLSDFSVYAVYYDFHTNILWASTQYGLDFSTNGGRNWNHVPKEEIGLRLNENIIRIGSTSDDLYCVTRSQFLKIDHFSGYTILPYAEPPLKDQVSWGSNLIKGLDYSRELLNEFTAMDGWNNELGWLNGPSLNEEAQISTIHTDRFGDMWIGTTGGPIFRGDQQLKLLEPEQVGLAQTTVHFIEEWEDNLWIVGIGLDKDFSGISLFDPQKGQSKLFRRGIEITMGNDQASSILELNDEWWFGSEDGIQIYNPKKDLWSHLRESTTKIDGNISHLETDNLFLYVGHSQGITRFNNQLNEPWSIEAIIGRWPVDALEWDGSNLWISSGRRLFRWLAEAEFVFQYGSSGQNFNGLQENKSPLISKITSIVSSESKVYFADSYGLLIFSKITGEWTRFNAESKLVGFKSLDLDSITLDNGKDIIWLATSKGALVINPETSFVRLFDKKDGLPSNKINAVKIADNYVWFGTDEGLCQFKWKNYLK